MRKNVNKDTLFSLIESVAQELSNAVPDASELPLQLPGGLPEYSLEARIRPYRGNLDHRAQPPILELSLRTRVGASGGDCGFMSFYALNSDSHRTSRELWWELGGVRHGVGKLLGSYLFSDISYF